MKKKVSVFVAACLLFSQVGFFNISADSTTTVETQPYSYTFDSTSSLGDWTNTVYTNTGVADADTTASEGWQYNSSEDAIAPNPHNGDRSCMTLSGKVYQNFTAEMVFKKTASWGHLTFTFGRTNDQVPCLESSSYGANGVTVSISGNSGNSQDILFYYQNKDGDWAYHQHADFANGTFDFDSYNTLKVVVDNDIYSVYINDKLVTDGTTTMILDNSDNPNKPTSGNIALMANDSCYVKSVEITPMTNSNVVVSKATTAPTIDGTVNNDEWGVPILQLTKANHMDWYSDDLTGTELDGMAQNAKIYATWDDSKLYLAAVVHDPQHYNQYDQGANMWNGSAVEFDVGFNLTTPYDRNRNTFAINNSGVNTGSTYRTEIGVNGTATDTQNNIGDTKATYKVTRSGEYTTYEVAFAWSDISPNGAPKVGDQVIFTPEVLCANGTDNSGNEYGEYDWGTSTDGGQTLTRNTVTFGDESGSTAVGGSSSESTTSPSESSSSEVTTSSSENSSSEVTTSSESSDSSVDSSSDTTVDSESTTDSETTSDNGSISESEASTSTSTGTESNPGTGDARQATAVAALLGACACSAIFAIKKLRK